MRVSEVFKSIQGEGPRIGYPTIFLRLSGCNLSCDFCDTKYHKKGDKVILSRLEYLIKSFNLNDITITGGEPTLQEKECKELIKRLPEYHTSIETNGVIKTGIDYDTIIVSPKKQNIVINNLKRYAKLENCFFKFVYEDKHDVWWEKVIKEANINTNKIYIMPEGASRQKQINKMPEVVEYCKDKGYNFTPRLHTLIWGNKRRK